MKTDGGRDGKLTIGREQKAGGGQQKASARRYQIAPARLKRILHENEGRGAHQICDVEVMLW